MIVIALIDCLFSFLIVGGNDVRLIKVSLFCFRVNYLKEDALFWDKFEVSFKTVFTDKFNSVTHINKSKNRYTQEKLLLLELYQVFAQNKAVDSLKRH